MRWVPSATVDENRQARPVPPSPQDCRRRSQGGCDQTSSSGYFLINKKSGWTKATRSFWNYWLNGSVRLTWSDGLKVI